MKRTRKVRVPGYDVVDVLGTGAMATVYRAVQTTMQRPVALKVLHEGVARDADYRERFLREARSAARLSHRNIVRAYEAGVHEGTYWFAMELVEGEDLDDRLLRVERLPELEALDIAIEVGRGLEAAQEHGLIHRDVKPENVLLGQDGSVKLADLGLAKAQGDGSITAEGMTVGTVAFLSPEQCRGVADLDIRSDLWALGGLIFAMVTGELPFGRGENAVVTMKRIVQEEPPSLAGRAGVSAATADAVSRLMRRSRDERPASATEAVRLLQGARARAAGGGAPDEDSTSTSRRGTRRARKRGGSAGNYVGARLRETSPTALLVPLVVAVGVGVGTLLALRAGSAEPQVVVNAPAPPPPAPRPATPAPRPTTPAPAPATEAARVEPTPAPATPDERQPRPAVGVRRGERRPAQATETVEAPATPADEPPPEAAPPAPDLSRVRRAAGATSIEGLSDGRVRLEWALDEAGPLTGWTTTGDGDARVQAGGLVVSARARGSMDVALSVPLRPPIEVRYSVRVTTPAFGKRGVLWTTFGPSLASFSGAALYAVDGGTASHLAGSSSPQSVIGGTRRDVRLTLDQGTATGWVDGRERYRHPVDVSAPVHVAFHVEGGVAIDVRDIVVEGALDPEWQGGRDE